MSKEYFIKLIREELHKDDSLTLFHGTKVKFLPNIEKEGLVSSHGYHDASWYMLSSDFESALFHGHPEKGGDIPVVEF